jgi:hypothetical protein
MNQKIFCKYFRYGYKNAEFDAEFESVEKEKKYLEGGALLFKELKTPKKYIIPTLSC